MMYCRNFCSLLLIVFLGFSLIGCGAEVPSEPGEEVVTDKWVDPKDIGKEYRVNTEDIKEGDTVLLSDGETHLMTILDTAEPADDGTAVLHTYTAEPVPNKPNRWRTVEVEKTIVLEGDPIVYLSLTDGTTLTKDNNVGPMGIGCWVEIDRIVDYHFPIYLEYRTQDFEALGGQVHVIRFIAIVKKGGLLALFEGNDTSNFYVGDREEHQKAYISILPYTELKKINLPAITGLPEGDKIYPSEIRIIPEGHTFRPYRIRSSSFLMTKPEIEDNW